MTEPVRLRAASETPVEAARRLEAEAKEHAANAARALLTDLILVAGRSVDIATLDSLPAGLRDLLRRVGEGIASDVEKAQAINARAA